jgi:hypothetical protein
MDMSTLKIKLLLLLIIIAGFVLPVGGANILAAQAGGLLQTASRSDGTLHLQLPGMWQSFGFYC